MRNDLVITGVAAGRGDRVGVGQAQHGDGADQEGVDQDIILQQTVLSGNQAILRHNLDPGFSLMITTGTGLCNKSHSTVSKRSCR